MISILPPSIGVAAAATRPREPRSYITALQRVAETILQPKRQNLFSYRSQKASTAEELYEGYQHAKSIMVFVDILIG